MSQKQLSKSQRAPTSSCEYSSLYAFQIHIYGHMFHVPSIRSFVCVILSNTCMCRSLSLSIRSFKTILFSIEFENSVYNVHSRYQRRATSTKQQREMNGVPKIEIEMLYVFVYVSKDLRPCHMCVSVYRIVCYNTNAHRKWFLLNSSQPIMD